MDGYDSPSAHWRADTRVIHDELGTSDPGVIQYVDEGWDSRVYLVNGGEAVFKFPRTPSLTRQLEHEVAALRLLEGRRLPVRIPKVRRVAKDLSYFGYEGIVGTPLSQMLERLDPRTRESIGEALGAFLKELHACDLTSVPRMGIEDEIGEYREKYRIAHPALSAAFTPREMKTVEAFFIEELPVALRRLGGEPRLCHGDLGPWNVIIGSDGGVGVIDFGDVGYYDASKDFSGFGDASILESAFAAYRADELLRRRAATRIRAFPVLDLPFYLGKGNRDGVNACIELARETVVRGRDPEADRVSEH